MADIPPVTPANKLRGENPKMGPSARELLQYRSLQLPKAPPNVVCVANRSPLFCASPRHGTRRGGDKVCAKIRHSNTIFCKFLSWNLLFWTVCQRTSGVCISQNETFARRAIDRFRMELTILVRLTLGEFIAFIMRDGYLAQKAFKQKLTAGRRLPAVHNRHLQTAIALYGI